MVDSHSNDSDATSSCMSLGIQDQQHSCRADRGSGDPMVFDGSQQTSRDSLDFTSMQTQMQGWQRSGNDEILPSIEWDDGG